MLRYKVGHILKLTVGRGWKCGSGKCRSRQSMESRKNKILGRLGLAAACADQQFETHSHSANHRH